MGLDMYFSTKISNYSWNDTKSSMDKVLAVFPHVPTDTVDSVSVNITLGYWRKANAIHNWFVQNVQGGEDNCNEYYVSREKIVELLNTVKKVLENRELAPTLLPPTSGFFFGSTELDEYYWGDLEHTRKVMENALKMLDGSKKEEYVTFYYQSSW